MAKKKTAPVLDQISKDRALLDKVVGKVRDAQRKYATFTQEQVDRIFRAAAIAAADVFRKSRREIGVVIVRFLLSVLVVMGYSAKRN